MKLTLEEFLQQYLDIERDLTECEGRLYDLEYPQRGNRIATGEHAGVSNQPEEYAVLREKLERKIAYNKINLKKRKRRIEAFLHRLDHRTSKLLRKKYIEGFNTKELASWMHIKEQSVITAVKRAIIKAEPEYEKFISK